MQWNEQGSWCTLNRRGHWHSSSCAGLSTRRTGFYCSSSLTLSSASALNVRKESVKRVNELHLLSVCLWGKGNPLAPGGNLPLSFELHLQVSGAAPVSVFLKNSAPVSFYLHPHQVFSTQTEVTFVLTDTSSGCASSPAAVEVQPFTPKPACAASPPAPFLIHQTP